MKPVYFFTFIDKDDITRKLTVIDGVPFYCSSGINSNSKGTWFPFLGLSVTSEESAWFRKPGFMAELSPHLNCLSSKYRSILALGDKPKGDDTNDGMEARFATLKCLVISSALGGGFWDTEAGTSLRIILQHDFPAFYTNNPYQLTDSKICIDMENRPVLSVESRKLHRRVNTLLESGLKIPLSDGFDGKQFVDSLNVFGDGEAAVFIPKDDEMVPSAHNYPDFPTKLEPKRWVEINWPRNFIDCLHITAVERQQTEQFIQAIHPSILDDISTNTDLLNYSTCKGVIKGDQFKGFTTYLNIKFLHNGEVVVFNDNNKEVVHKSSEDKLVFKVFNVSRGEWFVLKNTTVSTFIPYLKVLTQDPHIVQILDFTLYNKTPSQIEKLYSHTLDSLIMSRQLTTAQKMKFMLSLLQGLHAIHQTPYKFQRSKGFLFHSDIKFANIWYDDKTDDLVLGDFNTCGKWTSLIHSSSYVSPEFAIELTALKSDTYTSNHIITFNKNKGQALDIWNLGLVFAGLLQGTLCNNWNYKNTIYFPNLHFITDRMRTNKQEHMFFHEMANIQQDEIDAELHGIQQKLPQTTEGQQLKSLWGLVEQMLQVSLKQRPSCKALLDQMTMIQTNSVQQETKKHDPNRFLHQLAVVNSAQSADSASPIHLDSAKPVLEQWSYN